MTGGDFGDLCFTCLFWLMALAGVILTFYEAARSVNWLIS